MKLQPYYQGMYEDLIQEIENGSSNEERIQWILQRFSYLFDQLGRDYELFKQEMRISDEELEELSKIMMRRKF